MEFKGKISSAFRDIVTGKWNLTFSTDQNVAEAAQIFSGKDIDVKLKQHKEKRSLDANAYYWCLLTKLARIHGWSNAEAHNRMLRDYGQYERVEGQLIAIPLPDTDQTEREVLNKMEYHLALSPKVTIMKGETKRVYLLLRGSSTYNTEEMARLISGLIEECRYSGIPDSEIMTPFEKQKLYEQYGIGEKHEQQK
jgi:hypothetical protein